MQLDMFLSVLSSIGLMITL